MEEQEIKNLALVTILEWIGSPKFRERVKPDTILSATTLGREADELRDLMSKASGAFIDTYSMHRHKIQRVFSYLHELGYIAFDHSIIGRPRTRQISDQLWANATQRARRGIYHSDAASRRDERILEAPTSTSMVITVTDKIYEGLEADVQELGLIGKTRAEITRQLGLSSKIVNKMIRHLCKNGYVETRRVYNGKLQRVLELA